MENVSGNRSLRPELERVLQVLPLPEPLFGTHVMRATELTYLRLAAISVSWVPTRALSQQHSQLVSLPSTLGKRRSQVLLPN